MRSRVVSSKDMREKFGAEVQGFRYAFVLPTHEMGWEANTLIPVPQPIVPAAADDSGSPRRRAGDRKPTFIEVKPRA